MNPELVGATDLDQLSDRLEARELLPHLVRRLTASAPGATRLRVPAEEGIAKHGYDGRVDGGAGTPWVPAGASVWEMGAGKDPQSKAQDDYDKRTANPGEDVNPGETVFVFVTSRRWHGAEDWAEARRAEGVWRDVVALDADSLGAWLEETPDVHIWISERLDRNPLRAKTLERTFEIIRSRTRPELPRELFLAGREEQAEAFIQALGGSPADVIAVKAGSRDEALSFVAAVVEGLPDFDVSQPLVVSESEELQRLALARHSMMIVVSHLEGSEVADAISRGHRVILALGAGDHATDSAIVLPRIARDPAADALRSVGIAPQRAYTLSGIGRRSFAALQRELALSPGGNRPTWSSGDDGPLLCALLLVGDWTGSEGDDEVISSVAGINRAEAEMMLLKYAGTEDPPWARSAGGWKLVSPEDSWTLLNQYVTEELLQAWEAEAFKVLCEIDPRLGLDSTQQLLAEINDEPRAKYSTPIRAGLARAAALIAGRGNHALPSGLVPSRFATSLVSRLLDKANGETSGALWSSLADELPLIAEADPDVFLDAVAVGLSLERSPILAMFTDGPDSSPLTAPRSPHTGLLWAIEAAAWSKEHLLRAVLVLGELAARVVTGRLANTPAASLQAIFLPWCPQTGASLEGHLEALDALRERWPDVAWNLEMTLLPSLNRTGSSTHKPRFRDWDDDISPVDGDPYRSAIAERVEIDAGSDPSRWAELIPHLRGLQPEVRDGLLNRVEGIDTEDLVPEDAMLLWRALLDESEMHRDSLGLSWALGEAYANQLQDIAARFEISDSPKRHARLFSPRFRMPGIDKHDYGAQREALLKAQIEAATDTYREGGIAAVIEVAESCESPHAVGWGLAAADIEVATGEVVALLDGPEKQAQAGLAWIRKKSIDAGIDWIKEIVPVLDGISADSQAAAMLQMRPGPDIWEIIESLSQDVQAMYWRKLDPYMIGASESDTGIKLLLGQNRPWAALVVVASKIDNDGEIDADTAEQVLRAAAQSDPTENLVQSGYEVGLILDAMERSGATIGLLAEFEIIFFGLLDNERQPKALSAAVVESPKFFVDLVSRAHPKNPGEDDVEQRWAFQKVLEGLSRIPGMGPDGDSVEDLRAWVDEARRKFAEADLASVGDEQIGLLLSQAPTDPDGIWPPAAVRDLLEDLRSEAIESGIDIGYFNARGVTMRGVYDGGAQERTTAAKLRSDAARLDANHPRSARLLRSMAGSYEGLAVREDREAQATADGR